jgi:Histidine phosphatase superfamily (branch 2)
MFVFTFILLARLISTQLTQNPISKGDTVFLTELTRHGARSPISNITKYIQRAWIERYGKGELTGVGMRQHYTLGLNMALKYKNLFADITHSEIYYVRSTDVNRTMMSA